MENININPETDVWNIHKYKSGEAAVDGRSTIDKDMEKFSLNTPSDDTFIQEGFEIQKIKN